MIIDSKKLITIGILGMFAVSLGALGAHFLKSKVVDGTLTLDQLDGFEKGVKYHMYHTIMMLVVVILNGHLNSNWLKYAYTFFLVGILLFSGSLYFLCTRNLFQAEWLKMLGPITPLGGICLIIGWGCIAMAGVKSNSKK